MTIDGDLDQSNNDDLFTFAVAATTSGSIVAESPQNPTLLSGAEFDITYRVSVSGIEPIVQSSVRTTASGFTILAATAESGSCVVTSAIATCSLGGIPVSGSRRVTLRLRAGRAGERDIRHALDAEVDDTNNDNLAIHRVTVNPRVDLVVQTDGSNIVVQTGQTFTRRFTVMSIGPEEARQSSFSVRWSQGIEVSAITAEDGICALGAIQREYRCPFTAPIESGRSRHVDVTFRSVDAARVRSTHRSSHRTISTSRARIQPACRSPSTHARLLTFGSNPLPTPASTKRDPSRSTGASRRSV